MGTDPADPFSEVFLKEKDAILASIGAADSALHFEVMSASATLRAAFDKAQAEKKVAKKAAQEKLLTEQAAQKAAKLAAEGGAL